MSVAGVITAKNERELLRSNILYHRYLGVERLYVYLDETTDDSRETLADLDFVSVSTSVSPERFTESRSLRKAIDASPVLRKYMERWDETSMMRQMLNAHAALVMAREEERDWLVFIDADELVCPDIAQVTEGDLARLLKGIDPAVEQVRFATLEILQGMREYGNAFAEATLFKRPGSSMGRWLHDPRSGRTSRFYVHDSRRVPRIRRFSWWYGHRMGKSAVRVSADAVPGTSHGFVRNDGAPLASKTRGYLLHYLMYDVVDFIKKYRNFEDHPDTYVSGFRWARHKRLWRDVVNDPGFSEEQIRDYYLRWIAFDDATVDELRRGRRIFGGIRRKPDVIEIAAVRDVFRKLQAAPGFERDPVIP